MEKVAVVRTRMSVPPPLPPKTTRRSVSGTGVVGISVSERPVSLDCHQTPPSAGATVFIANKDCSAGLQDVRSFPEVKIRNGHNSDISANNSVLHSGHIVTIKINPEVNRIEDKGKSVSTIDFNLEPATKTTVDVDEQQKSGADGCIRISVNNSDTIDELNQRNDNMMKNSTMQESFVKTDRSNSSYFYYGPFPCSPTGVMMSSGQCSPSDTLDSGTCSDLDSTPPPLPKKKNPKTNGVSVTVIAGQHNRASSITSSGAEVDSDDNESNISYDSLNSSELNNCETKAIKVPNNNKNELEKPPSPPVLPVFEPSKVKTNNGLLPRGLLQDIRDRSVKLSVVTVTPKADPKPVESVKFSNETRVTNVSNSVAKNCNNKKLIVIESTYEERTLQKQKKQDQVENVSNRNFMYDTDKFYTFHLNENVIDDNSSVASESRLSDDEETFAGYKDLLGKDVSATIRSAKGTVRGVKNRVRAGIATFLQMHNTTKSYHDTGKVVVYSTTMGTVRETYQQCLKVKQILRTLLIKFEERDMFMSSEYQAEIRERMRCDQILVPQVFVDGQHIGDAETVERLNESGELRRILKPYKSLDACTTCKMCGGYRLLPCPVCNGSKKSVHRNHFTTEFVALKCMNCDEVGLVRCHAC